MGEGIVYIIVIAIMISGFLGLFNTAREQGIGAVISEIVVVWLIAVAEAFGL